MSDRTSDSDIDNPAAMDSTDSGSDSEVSRGRKRARKVSEWKSTVAKVKRNQGRAYVSVKTNKLVGARAVGNPCRDGCFGKVSADGVKNIFKSFWDLESYDVQNTYIQRMVDVVPVKRKRTKEESKRASTRHYNVMVNNVKIKVCKEGFMAIHNISTSRLTTALKKVTSTGVSLPDQRGRRVPVNKIVGEKAALVREHINLLPAMSCHYSRAKTPHRRYLESHLTIEKLYGSYTQWMQIENPEESLVSLHYYTDVFTKEFNISFDPPRTDTCTTCDTLNTAITNAGDNEAQVQEKQLEKDEHVRLANQGMKFMKDMEKDNNNEVRAICVDLQQTLPTPKMSTSIAYYKRKLWTYNLCIHNLKTNESIMYVWDETIAKRGSIEVASCIKHWLDEESAKEDFMQLVVVSDNCPGQNKNINIAMFYLRELHSKRLSSVDHVYLVPGHSYMHCDRAFGHIERHLRRFSDIVTPDDYARLISVSISKKYKVVRMTQADFLDYGAMTNAITKRKAPGSTFKDSRKIMFRLAYREGYLLKGD